MVGFTYVSDTDDESAIDQIISQAQDACVLEQVSTINCAFLTDSVLPTDLESRFRKLKSFPVTKSKQLPKTSSARGKAGSSSLSNEQTPHFSPSKQEVVSVKSKHGSVSSPSNSSYSSEEGSISSLFKQKLGSKQKSKGGSQSSPGSRCKRSQRFGHKWGRTRGGPRARVETGRAKHSLLLNKSANHSKYSKDSYSYAQRLVMAGSAPSSTSSTPSLMTSLPAKSSRSAFSPIPSTATVSKMKPTTWLSSPYPHIPQIFDIFNNGDFLYCSLALRAPKSH
ncbi:putative protein TPRXL [Neltuma alba]|uniref:putative protein TPRXL n=1 Tax=Neltuma alba TaxID=207710 RepID=UPI0010A49783|nr:putative protein TPRXL [Prosopis alba]